MKADQLAELPQWKSSGWEDGVPRRDEKTRRGRGRWIEGATAFVMSYHEIVMTVRSVGLGILPRVTLVLQSDIDKLNYSDYVYIKMEIEKKDYNDNQVVFQKL